MYTRFYNRGGSQGRIGDFPKGAEPGGLGDGKPPVGPGARPDWGLGKKAKAIMRNYVQFVTFYCTTFRT